MSPSRGVLAVPCRGSGLRGCHPAAVPLQSTQHEQAGLSTACETKWASQPSEWKLK